MNRREIFSGIQSVNSKRQNFDSVARTNSGLAPYNGTWTNAEVRHLLKRTMFGSIKSDLNYFLGLSMNDSVDTILELINHPAYTPPSPPLNNYSNILTDPQCAAGQPWPGTPDTNNGLVFTFGLRRKSLKAWWMSQILNQSRSIREKMVLFWYHFIPVNFDDVRDLQANSATMCNDYMNLLRTNALGNFKTLIKAIAKMPAMLVFLSNQSSTANVPNENFARELMELFTLGKVPTQNYTEADVIAASKVLSGWRVPSFTAAYPFAPGFNASYHNQTNKVFSSNFANTTIVNQSGVNGANEFDTFFNMLFTQQQDTIARYICRRLYRFFVYYDIDANVEANVIVPLAAFLITSNWEMALIQFW